MEYEKFNEPYEIVKGVENGRLVQITIRAVGDNAELTYDEIREAARQILDHYRQAHQRAALALASDDASTAVRQMVKAYTGGQGRVTEDYLARLAVAYEDLVPRGRSVSASLAYALGAKLPTVKGHIMRARREGYLSEAIEGREGGEATAKARELIRATADTPAEVDEIDTLRRELEITRKQMQDYKRLAEEFAIAVDEKADGQRSQQVAALSET